MNGGGVLLAEKEPLRTAALCHEVLTRPGLKAALLAGQEKALAKYRRPRTGRILLDYLRAQPAAQP
jgi:hypothetical protein